MLHKTCLVFLVVLPFFSPTVCIADELVQSTDANGNVIWTNSGPTQHEQREREEIKQKAELDSVVQRILDRHPELGTDQRVIDIFIELRNRFQSQGNSLERSMYLAEESMLKKGYLTDQKHRVTASQPPAPTNNEPHNSEETTNCSMIFPAAEKAHSKLKQAKAAIGEELEIAKDCARRAKNALEDAAREARNCNCNPAFIEFDSAASKARHAQNAMSAEEFEGSLNASNRRYKSAIDALSACK